MRGVPENARGIPASSPFWDMNEREQVAFKRGWRDEYHHRKGPKSKSPAYDVGRKEAVVMLRTGGTDE